MHALNTHMAACTTEVAVYYNHSRMSMNNFIIFSVAEQSTSRQNTGLSRKVQKKGWKRRKKKTY